MPGRPMKLAANMTRLECDAFCLAADIWLTMPRKYEKAPPPHAEHDAVWQGWRRCSHFALQLHDEVFKQANRMRQKAGLEPISDSWLDEPESPPNDKLAVGVAPTRREVMLHKEANRAKAGPDPDDGAPKGTPLPAA